MADDENKTHKSQYYMQVKQKLLDVSMHFIGWYKAVKTNYIGQLCHVIKTKTIDW